MKDTSGEKEILDEIHTLGKDQQAVFILLWITLPLVSRS